MSCMLYAVANEQLALDWVCKILIQKTLLEPSTITIARNVSLLYIQLINNY